MAFESGARTLRAAVTAAVLALPVAGCGSGGFQPLYGSGAGAASASEKLSAVEFAPIPGRVGQRIRNELVFDRSAVEPTGKANKRLEVKLTESVLTSFVSVDGNSTGQIFQIEASYRLIDATTQKVEFEGRSLGRTNFDRFESIYANVRAREDAENRAASTIAADIRTRLTAHLSRG
jgi:LPS-assembly lipoprotein